MNHALDPIRHLYGDDRSAETPPASPPLDGPAATEYRLLAETKAVLDRMPRPAPDPATLDAVRAMAAAQTFGPLLHAYGEDAPPLDRRQQAEADLLAASKAALDALPRQRPDAAVLAAVAAMAADQALAPVRQVYGEGEVHLAPGQQAEAALLDSTRAVLDAQPRSRPDDAVLAAVAAMAEGAAGPTPVRPRAADRPAQPRTARRWGAWIGSAAALVLVAVTGIWSLQNGPAADLQFAAENPQAAEARSQAAQADELEAETPPEQDLFAEALPAPMLAPERQQALGRAAAPPSSASRPADADAAAGFVAAASATPREDASREALRRETAAATPGEPLPVASWEAGADVRVLSLRLQQMAASNEGLAWDDPVVPLGSLDAEDAATDPGIQSVRSGANPSRVEARMRSAAPVRSSGQ